MTKDQRETLLDEIESHSELGYSIMQSVAIQYILTASEAEIEYLFKSAKLTVSKFAPQTKNKALFSDFGVDHD